MGINGIDIIIYLLLDLMSDSLLAIPDGLVGLVIEGGVYDKFVSTGKMPEAVFNTWLEIWGDKEFDSKRAYKADFTIHGEKYNDGPEAEVETYISIKS